MAGSFWHRRRGSGEKLWRWRRSFPEVFVDVSNGLGLLQTFPPVRCATPTDGFEQYHAFSNDSEVLHMTALLIMRCRAGPCHCDFLHKSCSKMFKVQVYAIPPHLPPSCKCRHGQGFRGCLKTEGRMRKATLVLQPRETFLVRKSQMESCSQAIESERYETRPAVALLLLSFDAGVCCYCFGRCDCRSVTSARSTGFVKPWGTACRVFSSASNRPGLHRVGTEDDYCCRVETADLGPFSVEALPRWQAFPKVKAEICKPHSCKTRVVVG